MSAAAPKSFSFLFLVPDDITPTIFRDGGQQACPLGNPPIGRFIVESDTILQARLREIPNCSVFPLRRLSPAFCSLGNFDLNGAARFTREIAFNNVFWNSQDTITATIDILWPTEIDHSIGFCKPTDDRILGTLEHLSNVSNCKQLRHGHSTIA